VLHRAVMNNRTLRWQVTDLRLAEGQTSSFARLQRFVATIEGRARSAGATRIELEGLLVANEGFTQNVARRLGYQVQYQLQDEFLWVKDLQ
jgi:hypothetical protein